MPHPLYIFTFEQQVLGTTTEPCRYMRHSFMVETHQEAFMAWCAVPSVQNIPMGRLGTLRVEVTPAA